MCIFVAPLSYIPSLPSSFLVADRVQVASVAAKTSKNPNPAQYVFSSGADENSFDIYPDPRGNALGRGTEITLFLKGDAVEYLDTKTVTDLVYVLLLSPQVLPNGSFQKQALGILYDVPYISLHSAYGVRP